MSVTQGGEFAMNGATALSLRITNEVFDMANKRTFGGEVREILGDAAKEMGFAVDSIRNEVIEKGWFDKNNLTPEVADKWLRDNYEPQGAEAAQDFSREDVYGDDRELGKDWDNVRDVEQERHRDPLGEAQWDSHKDKAEQFYGRDIERDEGMDI